MSNGGNTIMWIAGLAAVAGIGYYMHKAGYFDAIFDAINKAIDEIKNTSPLDGDKDPVKIKCKDGKMDTQEHCDKQAKCASGEHWSPSAKKCVKGSKLALAYVTPTLGGARMRAYRLYYR